MNMAAEPKFIAKNNKTTTSASKTWHLGNSIWNSAIICSEWTSPRTL